LKIGITDTERLTRDNVNLLYTPVQLVASAQHASSVHFIVVKSGHW